MRRLKLWVEREMHIRKWRESDFEKAAGIPYREVSKLFEDAQDFENRMKNTFKNLRGVARAFQAPLETVLCEAELYSGDGPQSVPVTKLVESLNEEQKELIYRIAVQLKK